MTLEQQSDNYKTKAKICNCIYNLFRVSVRNRIAKPCKRTKHLSVYTRFTCDLQKGYQLKQNKYFLNIDHVHDIWHHV